MRSMKKALFTAVMFWTVLTTVFAWLPLVRIIARPEGYQWSIAGLSGTGAEGPYWIFIVLTLYALILLFNAYRGSRSLLYPLLILWHIAVTAVVVAGIILDGSEAAIQGQGLRWIIPLWVVAIPSVVFTVLAIAWTVIDYRSGAPGEFAAWTRDKHMDIQSLKTKVNMPCVTGSWGQEGTMNPAPSHQLIDD